MTSDIQDTLLSMGFETQAIVQAMAKYPNDMDGCINFLTGQLEDDIPPPLVAIHGDNPPSYYDHSGWAPPNAFGPPQIGPYLPTSRNKSTIDLTLDSDGEDTTTSTTKKDQLQVLPNIPNADSERELTKAIGESLAGYTSKEDEEVNKAMEASMMSLQSDHGDGKLATGFPDAKDRAKDDVDKPTLLRSTSPHFAGFAAYLQCLHAIPLWRSAILNFRPSEDELDGCEGRHYEGVWKGDHTMPSKTLTLSNAPESPSLTRILSLQRLFAIMHLTKRTFVHITELEEVMELRAIDWRFGKDWESKIKEYHELLVSDWIAVNSKRLVVECTEGKISATDLAVRQRDFKRHFQGAGREVFDNAFIDTPLPADTPTPFTMLQLNINIRSPLRDTIYTSLDRQLVNYRTSTPPPPPEDEDILVIDDPPSVSELQASYSMVTAVPYTLAFEFQVSDSGVGGVDGVKGVELEKTIWLDRYVAKARVKVAESRRRERRLKEDEERVKGERERIIKTKDGKDAIAGVRQALEYLQEATVEDPLRSERQQILAKNYGIILERMTNKVSEYDNQLSTLSTEISTIFEGPEFQKHGPYNLVAFLMRNGLGGRGNAWAVVKDSNGRWWKICDWKQEEVNLDDALKDKSGLFLNAGMLCAFYQAENHPVPEPVVPPFLQEQVSIDNDRLQYELLNETVTATATAAQTPVTNDIFADDNDDLSTLEQAIRMSKEANISVENIDPALLAASSVPLVRENSSIEMDSAPKADLLVGDLETETESGDVGGSGGGSGEQEDAEMVSVTDAEEDDEPALRLRGGGGESEEPMYEDEEEEEDDEEEGEEWDEDEVELGVLKPMTDEWNIDLAVGKVGGLPVWLDPTSPLERKDVVCSECGGVMNLLLQLNSPDDTRPHAAARTLYVFACRKSTCRSKVGGGGKTIRVLRIQTPSPNPFYPPTPESEARRKELVSQLDEQTHLADRPPAGAIASTSFAEWNILCEPEPYQESFLAEVEKPNAEDEADGEDAAEPDTKTGVDRAFLVFQERVERLPEQVLRFYRLPGVEEPEPLWVSTSTIQSSDVPPCPLCSSPRQVEFQILSTLLSYLHDDDFNFDSLLVYTCKENCAIPSLPPLAGFGSEARSGWAEECLIEQSFASDGVKFGS